MLVECRILLIKCNMFVEVDGRANCMKGNKDLRETKEKQEFLVDVMKRGAMLCQYLMK